MKVTLGRPSVMDASLLEDLSKGLLIGVRPRRYSKGQRKVTLFPFNVSNEDGEILDQGYVTVDVKTGRLIVDHRLEEFPIEDVTEEDEGEAAK